MCDLARTLGESAGMWFNAKGERRKRARNAFDASLPLPARFTYITHSGVWGDMTTAVVATAMAVWRRQWRYDDGGGGDGDGDMATAGP